MKNEFDSSLMEIEIRGSTVTYRFFDFDRVYEIRGVRSGDLAKLQETKRNDRFSSSATVQYLTHLYADSHYGPTGKKAKPARQSKRSLLGKTPYR